jgi:hypothetical protein
MSASRRALRAGDYWTNSPILWRGHSPNSS